MSAIRCLFIPETIVNVDGSTETMYSAVGLEHFIGAQGKTIKEAERAFEFVMHSTIIACKRLGIPPFQGIKPAPKMYQDAWNRADHERQGSPNEDSVVVTHRLLAA